MEVRLFLILSLIVFPVLLFAYAPKEGNIFAAYGPTLMKTYSNNDSHQPTSGWRGDFALFVQGDISSKGSLEISMYHFNKAFFREQEANFAAEEVEMMHIGLGYRYWIKPIISLGLAFASSYAISEAKIISKIPDGNATDTSARDVSENAIDFSIQYLFLENESHSFFLDARYSRDITARVGERADHYVYTLAFRHFIQGK